MFYEQDSNDRKVRKVGSKYVGGFLALLATYKAVDIMIYSWQKLTGHEVVLCIETGDPKEFQVYMNSVTLGYALTGCFTFIIGKIVLPKIIRRLMGDYDYPKN